MRKNNDTYERISILFLITKSNWGGAQKYVYDLATSLPQSQYLVTVALGGNGELKYALKTAGITVIAIPALQRDISVYKELQAFWQIVCIIYKIKPDVLHINSSKVSGIGAFIGRILRVPKIIFTAHAWAFNEKRPKWQEYIITFLHWLTVLLSHTTITVSQALQDQMKFPLIQRKMITIHNGIRDVDHHTKELSRIHCIEKNASLSIYANDVWTGTIGELHPIKQHDVMIRAVANVVAYGHHIRHIIIGTGELEQPLQNLITKLHLEQHVFLLGHIDQAARLLKAFDIYVQPSHSEALGYTVVEAAQAELPIIASNVGGIPEIITDQTEGVLIPQGDVAALSKALITLLSDPSTAHKFATAAKLKSTQFSMQNMINKTTQVYHITPSSRT